jgi:hypothetical protein
MGMIVLGDISKNGGLSRYKLVSDQEE